MTEDEKVQAAIDQEHLRMLSIGYTISGAMTAFFSLIGLVYAFIGIVMAVAIAADTRAKDSPPAFIGWIFATFGCMFFLLAIALALAKFRAAWCLKQRKSRTFCMVVAGISCLGIPYGTFLGICTFLVMGRPSIMRLFQKPEPE